jgi:hypothetical protein
MRHISLINLWGIDSEAERVDSSWMNMDEYPFSLLEFDTEYYQDSMQNTLYQEYQLSLTEPSQENQLSLTEPNHDYHDLSNTPKQKFIDLVQENHDLLNMSKQNLVQNTSIINMPDKMITVIPKQKKYLFPIIKKRITLPTTLNGESKVGITTCSEHNKKQKKCSSSKNKKRACSKHRKDHKKCPVDCEFKNNDKNK